jgi:SpoVK/Ycf46/Vps4 family AAA+-type ATPase
VILGTSRHPENGDPKALKGFFDKFLYIPYPDYPSRLMLWKTFMREAVGPKVRYFSIKKGLKKGPWGREDE